MPVSPTLVLLHVDEFSSLGPCTDTGAFTFEQYGNVHHREWETETTRTVVVSQRWSLDFKSESWERKELLHSFQLAAQ